MHLENTLIALALTSTVSGATIANGDSGVEKRQGTGTSILVGTIKGLLENGGLGGYEPQCECDDSGYKDEDGFEGCYYTWLPGVGEMCWHKGGHWMEIPDYDAMKCLNWLHHKQENICIDVEGSTCADEIGGADWTQIGNAQKGFNWFQDTAEQFTEEQVAALDKYLENIGAHSDTIGFGFHSSGVIEINALDEDNKKIANIWYRGTGNTDC